MNAQDIGVLLLLLLLLPSPMTSERLTIFVSPPATINFPSFRNVPPYAVSLNLEIDRINEFVTLLYSCTYSGQNGNHFKKD